MNKKIRYFMAKDTRLIVDNLSKVIINEDLLLIKYTIIKRNFKDEETTVIRYIKKKNRMIIYNELKDYNLSVYEGFIEWANEKGIECYSIGKGGIII